MSYSQDKFVFHVLVRQGLSFVVVAGSELGRRIPFAFLEDIQSKFRKKYGEDQVLSALAYAYNNEVRPPRGARAPPGCRVGGRPPVTRPAPLTRGAGPPPQFGRVLRQQMEFFTSDNPQADSINRVKEEINQVKSVMVQNIDKVLDRGERIELLVDKTDHLQNDAFRFRKAGRALKRQLWWNNIRTMGVLFFIFAMVIWFLVSMFCGWKLDKC